MDNESPPKPVATVHDEGVQIDGEIDTSASILETSAQKSLVFKLDCTLLPLFSVAYLLAYMDRNNIGYARLMGLQEDLGLSQNQFYNAVMIFYAGYLVTCFPANLLLRQLGPRVELSFAVLAFGVFVCCMCAARGSSDILGLRFGIGAAEALLQSCPLYLVIWYGRHELGKRIAFFYSASTLAGLFAGLIAYGVQKDLEGSQGWHSWKWLFLIEGVAAVGLGLVFTLLLPGFPDKIRKSWLFSDAELKIARARSEGLNSSGASFERWQIKASLLDPKTWLLSILAGANSAILASTGAFLPTIVKEFGYDKVHAQLFTIIPYACAFISMIIIGVLSDRFRSKSWFIMGSLTSCAIGLIILLATTGKETGMLGASLLVMGAYPSAVMQIAWIQITFCGNTKRATSWGLAMIFGQGLSMSGAQIYTTPPRFFKGHGVLLGFVAIGLMATFAARTIMVKENERRDEELSQYAQRGEIHPDEGKTFEETCDSHINFRYVL